MSGPDLCPKCKGLHYRRDPCIVRKVAVIAHVHPSKANLAVAITKVLQAQEAYAEQPKRGPGRPKTITDMAAYKAAKQREYRARKKASASEREK